MRLADARHIRSTNIRPHQRRFSSFSQRPLCTVARMKTNTNTRTFRSAIIATAVVLATLTAGACSSDSGSSASAGSAQSTGKIDPKNFTANVDNPYFPLKPGTTYRFRGFERGKNIDVFAVTRRVKKVLGVPCVVVRDRLFR